MSEAFNNNLEDRSQNKMVSNSDSDTWVEIKHFQTYMFSKLYLPASVPRQPLKEALHHSERGSKSRERETWVPGNQGPNARGWWICRKNPAG